MKIFIDSRRSMSDTVTGSSSRGSMHLVENMQRRPGRDRGSDSIRARGTQPALPGATMPTVPMVAPARPAGLYEPRSPAKQRLHYARRAVLRLLSLVLLREVLLLVP